MFLRILLQFLILLVNFLQCLFRVSTPLSDFLVVDRVYLSCILTFAWCETLVDLLMLDMVDFDVILGMDWLAYYHGVLDCYAKTMDFSFTGVSRIT